MSEWAAQKNAVERLGVDLRARLVALLESHSVPVHSVTLRLKDTRSLANKLGRPDRSYSSLWDVTDLLGLRVETYFDDHVERVARLIEAHFKVDFLHSGDRARPAGYRSVHYVCSADGAPHPSFRFEVQLRTVLQHAWAEVEHDLGYKADDEVPEAIRRRFTRVASLLEIADQEFVSIRRELAASRDRARELIEQKKALPIDLVSIDELTRQAFVGAIDTRLGAALGKPVSSAAFFPDYLVKVLRHAGLRTTDEVVGAVDRHGHSVEKVLSRYADVARRVMKFELAGVREIERGYGLFFVAHLAIARADELAINKVSRLTRLYQAVEFPDDERAANAVATALIEALA